MSRTKKYTIKQKLIKQQIKQKQNTNIIKNNNESLSLKIIYAFLKSKNIKYITEKNCLWYFIVDELFGIKISNQFMFHVCNGILQITILINRSGGKYNSAVRLLL